eukprot:4523239-Amphidinium_carterae.1
MKHVNSMSTATRQARRGCDPFTDSTLNQDASLSTAHVESNIQSIDRISTFYGKLLTHAKAKRNPLVALVAIEENTSLMLSSSSALLGEVG